MGNDVNRAGEGPLHLQIYDSLRQRILDGEWRLGDALPAEPALGETYGVARGTLRQALAALEASGYISRQRGRGTFVTWNGGSPRPARAASGQIGFVVPYVRDSYVTTILLGVERAASERGLSVTFKHVDNSLEKQGTVVQELVSQGAAGIIVYPVDSIHASPLDDLIRTGYPIVLVDRYLRGVPSDYVISDHFGGALRVTQHLARLGHHHIGFVTWADPAISMEHRFAGYQRALAEANLPADPALILEVASYPTIDRAALTDYLLRKADAMSAVFAANDQIALAIYEVARRAGIPIPEALAVVGFDDLEFTAHLDVPLTTVAQSAFTIGEQAVEALLRRLRGEVIGWQQIILPTRLVIRESCGFRLGPREFST